MGRRVIGAVLVAASAVGIFYVARSAILSPPGLQPGRVVILGFDGVEPSIVESMMDEGALPNLAALKAQGSYARLQSSNPPQSPAAWSSFTTGTTPGNHGIYDFLRRDPKRYAPSVGFGSPTRPVLAADGSLATAPGFENIRQGKSFWQIADEQGARAKVLLVPFAFPAENLEQGCMLSGLGVTDIRGTTSWFHYMSEGISEPKSRSGDHIPLRFEGNEAEVTIRGLRHPDGSGFVGVDITIKADRENRTVTVRLPDQDVTLRENEWSPWLEWTFDVTEKYAVQAISRIHVLEAGEQIRLYMTCLQFHPDDPYMRFTTPPNYGGDLADRYGLYKTIGWAYDTHALRQDVLTDDLFLEDVRNTMAWRETLTLDELDRGDFDLLISVWTGTDRVAHLFWRFRDPKHPLYTEEGAAKYGKAIEDTYRRMDEIVGKAMAKLGPNDLLMILSDHGFHSFRTGFNVNTWLIRNGYLAVAGQSDSETATNTKPYLQGYDWANTKAYSLGLGSIFLNLKGREGQGTVDPGEVDPLIQEIRAKLLEVTGPDTGERIFDEVYTRDYFHGRALEGAPDLQLGYAEGYQSTKATAAGSAPDGLFEANEDKWSGDHAASDVASTPGIFFSNKPISSDAPSLLDLSVTALKYLGKTVPESFEGNSLLSKNGD